MVAAKLIFFSFLTFAPFASSAAFTPSPSLDARLAGSATAFSSDASNAADARLAGSATTTLSDASNAADAKLAGSATAFSSDASNAADAKPASGQDRDSTLLASARPVHSDSVLVLGRPFHRSVIAPLSSADHSKSNIIDTLPTAVKGVSVLLYNDNTWRYCKSAEYIADSEVFNRAWDNTVVNPYKAPVDSIPEVWSLWLVDSLSEYHTPALGRISSLFGIRHGRRHQGIDLAMPTGTPLYATFDGKVRMSTVLHGYGSIVVLRHNNGLETFYGHLSRRDVKVGDIVHAGDRIGLSGNSGRSTGPHLHFETRYDGLAFDPQRIINFTNGDLKQRIMVLKRRYFDNASRYDQNFDDEFLLVEDDAKALAEKKRRDEEAARRAMVYHTVRSGDCLSKLATKYRTSVSAICRLNKGMTPSKPIRIGQKIRVR